MPIVKKNTPDWDSLIEPFEITDGIPDSELLPPIKEIANSLIGGTRIANAEFSRDSSRTSVMTNQLQLANLVTNIGLPLSDGLWDGAEGLISMLPDKLRSQFNDLIDESPIGNFDLATLEGIAPEVIKAISVALQDIIEPAIEVVTDVVQVATSWIPIVGAFVKLTTALIQLSIDLHPVSAYQPETTTRLDFSPYGDRAYANRFLAGLRGVDGFDGATNLNRLFHPLGTEIAPIKFVEGTEDKSSWRVRRFVAKTAAGTAVDKGWMGMLPGANFLDMGWEISKYATDTTGTRSLGEALVPTTTNLGSKTWGMIVQSGSPMMFTLDPSGLRQVWIEYLFSLRVYLENLIDTYDWEEGRNFVNTTMRNVYGWSCSPSTKIDPKKHDYICESIEGNNAKVSGGIATDLDKSFGLGTCAPVLALENLAQLQAAALDHTVVCAYIDASFPALKKNPALKSKWETNRQLLLQHKDRCRVDVNSIPDKAYRDAMAYALQNCPPPPKFAHGGPTQIASVFTPISNNPVEKVPVRATMTSTGDYRDELTGRGSSGAAGLLLAAAVLGLLAFNKK